MIRFRSLVYPLLPLAALLAPSFLHGADTITWKNIGPGGGGNIRVHTVSPGDPSIILAGADVGGIYRSSDMGITWTLVNHALVAPNEGTNYNIYNSFAFDPFDPNVVYSGSFKSTDAGLHWQRVLDLGGTPVDFGANGALVDPTEHPTGQGTVYLFAYGDIRKSTCGWNGTCPFTTTCPAAPMPCPAGSSADTINSLVLDPADPNSLMACSNSGIYRSEDGADTWSAVEVPGYTYPDDPPRCNKMVVHEDTGSLFAVLETTPANDPGQWQNPNTWEGGVFKSDDWGESWDNLSGPFTPAPNLIPNGDFENPVGPPGSECVEAPTNWAPSAGVTRVSGAAHSGNCSIRIDYTAGSNIDTSPRIPVQAGKLYHFSAWYKIAPASTGYPANAKITSFNASGTVNWIDSSSADVQTWYVPSWGSSGPEWRKFETFITPIGQMDSFEIRLQATLGPGTVWIDDVVLEEWNALPRVSGIGQTPSFVSFSAVAVHPNNANIIYVGTKAGPFNNMQSDIQGVWRTTDGGVTWKNVTRAHYKDNVLDGIGSASTCGDLVCSGKSENPAYGRYEDMITCPGDCPLNCGNGLWEQGENQGNCLIDTWQGALQDDIVPGRNYYEAITSVVNNVTHYASGHDRGMHYNVWNIAVSCSTAPCHPSCTDETCLRLYWGGEHMRSTDGGEIWEDFASQGRTPQDTTAPQTPVVAWMARGETTDTFVNRVVTDARDPHRVYYADKDNRLQVSLDAGKSFETEGWQWSVGSYLDPPISSSAGNVVLGPTVNEIYVASSPPPGQVANAEEGGVVKGTFVPTIPPLIPAWDWSHIASNPEVFPKGGGFEMIRDTSNNLFVAVYGKGVYKLTNASGLWTCLGGTGTPDYDDPITPENPDVPGINCSSANGNWGNPPKGDPQSDPLRPEWQLHPFTCVTTQSGTNPPVCDTSLNRFYVGAGYLFAGAAQDPNETGVWESNDGGDNWCKISSSNADMNGRAVIALRPNGPDTLYAGVWDYNTGPAGLYRGTRNGPCSWTWSRKIIQPRITSVAVSPANSSVLYAVSSQLYGGATFAGQVAGIYKSTDNGLNWTLTTNNGLMNLRDVRLDFNATDPTKLYASTEGSGVFEGSDSDDDGDGVLDASDNCPLASNANQSNEDGDSAGDACDPIQVGAQTVVLGTPLGDPNDLSSTSANGTYVRYTEAGNPRRLQVIWTFQPSTPTTSLAYELHVEGFHETIPGDNEKYFRFTYATLTSPGSCSSVINWSPTLMTVEKRLDDDRTQSVRIPSSGPAAVFCIRVEDDGGSDNKTDRLTLDRLFLLPVGAPPANVVAAQDAAGGVGGTVTHTYIATMGYGEVRQEFKERSTTPQLIRTWRFNNVPAGSNHLLRIEGYRTSAEGESFQFWYAQETSPGSGVPGTFFEIPGATISSGIEAVSEEAFGGSGLSGTVFIRVTDTISGGGSADTVFIDQVLIKTQP